MGWNFLFDARDKESAELLPCAIGCHSFVIKNQNRQTLGDFKSTEKFIFCGRYKIYECVRVDLRVFMLTHCSFLFFFCKFKRSCLVLYGPWAECWQHFQLHIIYVPPILSYWFIIIFYQNLRTLFIILIN